MPDIKLNTKGVDLSVFKKTTTDQGEPVKLNTEGVDLSVFKPQESGQPLTYMQKELRQKFPENYTEEAPESITKPIEPLGTIDQLKQDYITKTRGKEFSEANPISTEQGFAGKLGSVAGNSFMTGMNNLNSWAADAPGFIYDLAGAPFRAVGLNVPTSQQFKGGALEQVSDYFKGNAKAYEQKVQQANPSRGNGVIASFEKGDIEGGILNLAGGIAESAPASIAMMLSGGATAPTILGGAAIFGAGKAQEMDENAPEMDYDKRRIISALNGTIEGIFETYLGSGAVGKSLAGIIKKEGKDVAKEQVKRSMNTAFADMITKNPWLAPLGEGFEEVGTQISQNFVDKYSGYKPDLNLTEGVADSWINGVAMGGIHGSIIGLAKKAMEENNAAQPSEPTGQLPDSTPQPTVDPKFTAEQMSRANIEQITHNDGSVQTFTDPKGNEFAILSETPGGMAVVIDQSGNKSTMAVSEIKDRKVQTPDEVLSEQMQLFDQENQPKEQDTFKYNGMTFGVKNILEDGSWEAFEVSEDGTPTGNVEIIDQEAQQKVLEQLQANPQAEPSLDTIEVGKTKYTFTPAENNSLKSEVYNSLDGAEKARADIETVLGSKNNIEIIKTENPDPMQPDAFTVSVTPKTNLSEKDGENFQFDSLLPSGDNGLKADPTETIFSEPEQTEPKTSKIVTQKIGSTSIDIVETEDYDEVVPTDKVPLEKALPALEKKFKDNPKFELQVEKEVIEIPGKVIKGETKWDEDIVEPSTKQTVIKSIRIVPKEVIERKKKADTDILLDILDEFNATPQSRSDKQKAREIESIAKDLGYQTDKNASNQIRLFDNTGTISKPNVSKKENIETENQETISVNESQIADDQLIKSLFDSESEQKSQLQNNINQNNLPNDNRNTAGIPVTGRTGEPIEPTGLDGTGSGGSNVPTGVSQFDELLQPGNEPRVLPGGSGKGNQGIGPGKHPKPKVKSKSTSITGKAKEIEVVETDLKGLALKYFVDGGMVTSDDVLKQFKGDNGERLARMSYTSNSDGLTIAQIAHNIEESLPESVQAGLGAMDVFNAVEDIINTHNSPISMAKTLLEIYSEDPDQGYSKEWIAEQLQKEDEERQIEVEAWTDYFTELEKTGELPTENELIELFLPENNDNGQEIDSKGSDGINRPVNPEGNGEIGQNLQGSEPGVQGEVEGEASPEELSPVIPQSNARVAKPISKIIAVEHAGHEGAKRVTSANENKLEIDGYGTILTSQFINTLVENGRLPNTALKNRSTQLSEEYATKLLNENSDLFPKDEGLVIPESENKENYRELFTHNNTNHGGTNTVYSENGKYFELPGTVTGKPKEISEDDVIHLAWTKEHRGSVPGITDKDKSRIKSELGISENKEPDRTKLLTSYADKRYDSTISVGERYYDNRYGDFYAIESMVPFGESDVELTLKYDKGTTRTEKGSFVLYHIDAKQHTRDRVKPLAEVLSDGKKEVQEKKANQKNDNFVKNNEDGISESVSQAERRAQNEEDTKLQQFSNYLRDRYAATKAQGTTGIATARREEESRIALEYAKENGLWIADIYNLGQPFSSGNESTNVVDVENKVVYKSNNLMNTRDISTLLTQIEAHNKLFPETRYDLVGFTGIDNGSNRAPLIEVVLKQQLIGDAIPATEQEIESYMTNLGFTKNDGDNYSNGEYNVFDLHPRNVLKDSDGDLYVIDNIIVPLKQKANAEKQSPVEPEVKTEKKPIFETLQEKSKENQAKKADSKYSVGDRVDFTFTDGGEYSGTIQSIVDGKAKIKGDNGKNFTVNESQITGINLQLNEPRSSYGKQNKPEFNSQELMDINKNFIIKLGGDFDHIEPLLDHFNFLDDKEINDWIDSLSNDGFAAKMAMTSYWDARSGLHFAKENTDALLRYFAARNVSNLPENQRGYAIAHIFNTLKESVGKEDKTYLSDLSMFSKDKVTDFNEIVTGKEPEIYSKETGLQMGEVYNRIRETEKEEYKKRYEYLERLVASIYSGNRYYADYTTFVQDDIMDKLNFQANTEYAGDFEGGAVAKAVIHDISSELINNDEYAKELADKYYRPLPKNYTVEKVKIDNSEFSFFFAEDSLPEYEWKVKDGNGKLIGISKENEAKAIENAQVIPMREINNPNESELNEPSSVYGNPKSITSDIGFYSPTEKALQTIQQNKGSVEQFKAMLLKNGAKQAEMDWMGFDEQFPDGKQSVTKADIQEWIDQNKIEVKEVEKGKDKSGKTLNEQEYDELRRIDDIPYSERTWQEREKHSELLSIFNNERTDDTKFSQYVEPGGENYKELLLTMPKESKFDKSKVEIKRNRRSQTQGTTQIYYDGKLIADYADDPKINWDGKYEQRPESEWMEVAERVFKQGDQNNGIKPKDDVFKSSHYDEPNILAHVRFNERTGENGERVLFIEEIQSDWAQSNRKELQKLAEPNRIREQVNNIFGSELSSVMPFELMDTGMISVLHHNEIRKDIISRIPVDVMDILKSHNLSAEDILSDNAVNLSPIPLELRRRVGLVFLNSLRDTGTPLRTKLLSGGATGGDKNLLSTLNASDLSSGEIAGMLSPNSIYHDDILLFSGGGKVAGFGAIGNNTTLQKSTGRGNETNSTMSADSGLLGKGALSGTKFSGSSLAGLNGEMSTASLAKFINWHNSIIKGNAKRTLYKGSPIVDNTKDFVNLSFRRMMLYAAENGFDRIAWTNGDMQAARYDLSKQIGEVRYFKSTNPKSGYDYNVVADDLQGRQVFSKELKENEIEDHLGKEIAKKIINDEGSPVKYGSDNPLNKIKEEGKGTLSGLDLAVGGSGMKAFYDAIIPSAANKLGKAFGAKVENTTIQTGNTKESEFTKYRVIEVSEEESPHPFLLQRFKDNKWNDVNHYDTESLAEEQKTLAENGNQVGTTVQSLPVTSQMKESVIENGVSLFEPKSDYLRTSEINQAYGSEQLQRDAIEKTVGLVGEALPVRDNSGGQYSLWERDKPTENGNSVAPKFAKVVKRTVFDWFKESGYIDVIGQEVKSAQDVADLWKIHRSPYIEKSHYIFLKDGVVVGNTAYTVNKSYTTAFPNKDILSLAGSYGANEVYLLHNHPSGNHIVSIEDVRATRYLDSFFGDNGIKLLGHVVIDHNKFSFIDSQNAKIPENDGELENYRLNSVAQLEYKNPVQKLFSEREKLPAGMAAPKRMTEIATALLNENGYRGAIVYLARDLSINGYEVFPEGATAEDIKRIAAKLRDENVGSDMVFVHDGSYDFNYGQMPYGTQDVINIKTGAGDYRSIEQEPGLRNSDILQVFDQAGLYHGSPHSFDKFSLDKMGTGEGAQAYGWGLYFTDKKEIAEDYANKLVLKDVRVGKTTAIALGQKYDNPAFLWMLDYVHGRKWSKEQIISELNRQLNDADWINKNKWAEKNIQKAIDILSRPENDIEPLSEPRNFYSIIAHEGKEPGEYDYLRWDKPLTEDQVNKIKDQLSKENMADLFDDAIVGDINSVNGQIAYEALSDLNYNNKTDVANNKEASLFLLRAGIDGIQYPSEYLSKGSNEKSFNYVVFDENAVRIDEHTVFEPQTPYGKSKPLMEVLAEGKRSVQEKKNTILINGVERSTLNSNGKPIASSEEGIRNFWKWFSDSKVVDKDGSPLVVYHGTPPNNAISEFYPYSFFAEDKYNALAYARSNRNSATSRKNGILMEVYLKFKNPYNLFNKTKSLMSLKEMSDLFKDEKINTHIRIDILNEIHKISEERFGLNHYYKFGDPDRIIELFNEYKGDLSDSILENPPTSEDVENTDEKYKKFIISKKEAYDKNKEFIKKLKKEGIDIRHFILGDNRSPFKFYYNKDIPSYLIASSETFHNYLKDNKFDSIILTDHTYSKVTKRKERSYLNFDPSQVKSATGNNGSFSTTDPSILNEPSSEYGKKLAPGETIWDRLTRKRIQSPVFESVNPEVNQRMKDARGIKGTTFGQKIGEIVQEIKEQVHHFKHITEDDFPSIYNKLRLFEAIPERVRKEAFDKISAILRPIAKNKSAFEAFERYIVLRDLVSDINSGLFEGKELPWGYNSKEEVIQDDANIQLYVANNPVLRKVIAERNAMMSQVRELLIDNGLLDAKAQDKENYFHHQVLEYMAMKAPNVGVSSKDVRNHRKGWQRSRTGSMKDYNTNYLESEFEVLAQSLEQLEIKDILRKIGKEADIMPSLVELANKENEPIAQENLQSDNPKDWKKFNRWKDYIPEGFRPWYPKSGTNAYKAASLAERAIQNLIDNPVAADMMEEMSNEVDKTIWVIDERLADQLNSMKDPEKENVLGKVGRKINSTWKQWMLLNPYSVIKYNFNNMSGDIDIVLAYSPAILKPQYAHTAMKEAWDDLQGRGMSQDIKEALANGVITSGLSIQEIPDINKEGVFKSLTGSDNLIMKYWNNTTGYTQFRENMLRLAAYKYFKDQLGQGKNLYAASNRKAIDSLTDINEKAGKLARELIGDYGNLSQGGQWLRSHVFPFWSWVEINSPRYYRLLKNTRFEESENTDSTGRIIGVGVAKTALNATKLSIKMLLLMGLVTLWNRLMFPDEDDELTKTGNRKLMLIVGRREDGSIMTVRMQGAFSDMLSFLGLEDATQDIEDVSKGKATVGKKTKEAGSVFVNKFAQGIMPVERSIVETALGKNLYPDVFNPRTARDRPEILAKAWKMDKIYRYLTKKPMRGAGKEMTGLLVYDNDPGQAAYYTMRQRIYDFLDSKEVERPGGDPTQKSNALYYYKQSLKIGNTELASYWLAKYRELGGTTKGMKASIEKGEVRAALPKRFRGEWYRSLDEEDKEVLQMADEWYNQTYRGKK